MITRRRLRVAAITASCAALAVLGAGSGAMASSNATTTGQIKACYQTSGSLPPLDHIATTGTCPTGDSSLTWNKIGPQGPQGPQGPAGISTGISASSTTQVTLNTGASSFSPVLSTPAAPVTGTYYISASVMVDINQDDGVDCLLRDNQSYLGVLVDVARVPNVMFETIPLAESVYLTAGQGLQVMCGDYNKDTATYFYDGAMTGTLINSASGNVAKPNMATRHPLTPHL